jgi:hypothetical protein
MSAPSHRLAAVRAADLLVLHVDFHNLEPGGIGMRRQDPAAPAHVVLRFPSQHLFEEAFVEDEEIDDGGAPLLARLPAAGGAAVALAGALGAAPSRVAFTVPEGVEELPAALEPLLDFLAHCRLNVVETAEGPGLVGLLRRLKPLLIGRVGGGTTIRGEGEKRRPSLVEPGPEETAIELPYRVILSPPGRAGFAHAARPPSLTGLDRAELWHSRLGPAPGEEGSPRDSAERTVRAVWVRSGDGRGQQHWDPTDAFNSPEPISEPPFLAPMDEKARHELAHLTSNSWQGLPTAPVAVERLALSSLGGWLDASGRWEPPKGLELEEWEDHATLGRDHYVKVVEAGCYFSWGHRSSVIQVTERKWQERVPGRPAALRKSLHVLTREPELRYDTGAAPEIERQMPLKRVRVLTPITPAIDWPATRSMFQVRVGGAPFRFAIEGEDEGGRVTYFTMPLVFVQLPKEGSIDIEAARKELTKGNAHRADLGGTSIRLAPERPTEPGATTFPVGSAFFDAELTASVYAGFHPKLADARVAIPAVEVATGKGAAELFEYAAPYVQHGFGPGNQGEVFAELPSPASLDLQGGGERAGGLISPAMKIGGLSRAVGPLGGTDLGQLAKGEFDPAKFFSGALGGAKLLGLFSLDKVIGAAGGLLDQPGLAPKLVTKQLPGGASVVEWTYAPRLKPYPDKDGAIFVPRPGAGALTLNARFEAGVNPPRAEIDCTLAAVDVSIPSDKVPCVVIPIERIRFHAVAGAKLDVDVELGKIRFGGPLEFVNELRKLIPEKGFSDPPALEVTPQGVSSGFSLALPDVAIGMFALQHVSLGARFELPFVGPPPTFAFNFCTRNEPFLLTVSAFGGGGFFLVKVDPEGMQRLEASLEFGASVSMNLGVASGGVHVMAGIYFAMETGKGAVLTGYFRAGGNVSVLGIVSISIELYLGLSYETATKKAIGRASLTVEIEVCLFSASVEITCERKLAGSAGDPPLVELLAPYDEIPDKPGEPPRGVDPWAEYCAAYA